MFKNFVRTSRKAQRLYCSNGLLILFEEIVSAYSENRKKHINAACGQNADLVLMFTLGGTYISGCTLKS
jgi:hypothetical protein